MLEQFRTDLRGPYVVELLRAGTRLNAKDIIQGMSRLNSFDDILKVFPQLTKGNAFSRAAEDAEKALSTVVERKILCRTFFDPNYPSVFKSFPSPPPLIYSIGNPELPDRLITVSGTNTPTAGGRLVAQRIGAEIAERGWGLVANLFNGVEGIAAEAALAKNGKVCIVLSMGFDKPTKFQTEFIERVLGCGGIVLTEVPLGAGILVKHLIQSTETKTRLSKGLIVIQPSLKEGGHNIRTAINAKRPVIVARLPEQFRMEPENALAEVLLTVKPQNIFPYLPILGNDPVTVKNIRDVYTERNRPCIGFPIHSREDYPDLFRRLEVFRNNTLKESAVSR